MSCGWGEPGFLSPNLELAAPPQHKGAVDRRPFAGRGLEPLSVCFFSGVLVERRPEGAKNFSFRPSSLKHSLGLRKRTNVSKRTAAKSRQQVKGIPSSLNGQENLV